MASWTNDLAKRARRIKQWKAKHEWYTERTEMFALSKAFIEEDPAEDDLWECVDLLGEGSFGQVGKWCKFNRDGRVIGTMAIKQMNYERWMNDSTGRPGIPGEAALVSVLCSNGCRVIPQLRSIRYFDVERPKWRICTEYCAYGTLFHLINHYREKNNAGRQRLFLPEGFIWQAFRDFAVAFEYMANFRSNSLEMRTGDGYFLLHMDLKDSNVLLGNCPQDKKYLPYHQLKIADWGMAEVTTLRDAKNSRKIHDNGTVCWMPPEQRDSNRYGDGWKDRVMGTYDRPYNSRHVIWQMAACIYGMMELDINNVKLERHVKEAENQESRLVRNNYSPLFGYDNRRYSKQLCQMVEDCLIVVPRLRPRPEELMRRVNEGLAPYLREYQRTGYGPEIFIKG